MPATSGTLMPADVDRYLAAKSETSLKREESVEVTGATEFERLSLT